MKLGCLYGKLCMCAISHLDHINAIGSRENNSLIKDLRAIKTNDLCVIRFNVQIGTNSFTRYRNFSIATVLHDN